MIIGFEKADITNWKADLQNYEQRKRGKLPTQKIDQKRFLPLESQKKRLIDPPLQKYPSAELKIKPQVSQVDRSLRKYMSNQFRYQKQYDIISLHPMGDSMAENELQKHKKNNAPIRNLYNIINGDKLSGEYLKERHIILPPQYSKKGVENPREFNIVNLEYKDNNESRQAKEVIDKKEQLLNKYNNSHVYDKIYSRYYSPQQEEKYWTQKQEESMKVASQNFEKKLPHSYQVRERFIQDLSKPLPQGLKQLDKARENNKRSHQLKYIFQEKYSHKNIEEAQRVQAKSLNKYKKVNALRLNNSAFAASSIDKRLENLQIGKIKSFGFGSK